MAYWLVALLVSVLLGAGFWLYWDALPQVRSLSALRIPGAPGIRVAVLPGDPAGLTLDEVMRLDRNGAFTPLTGVEDVPVYNTRPAQERWFRFQLDNRSPRHRQGVLDLVWRIYDVVDYYEVLDNGEICHRSSGSSVPLDDPDRTGRRAAFDLVLQPGEYKTAYLRVQDYFRLPSQFFYWPSLEPFARWERFVTATDFAYACLWVGMSSFGIFLYALLRERAQRHYLGFLLGVGGVHFISSGMMKRFVTWPEWPLAEICTGLLGVFAMVEVLAFVRDFLNTEAEDPWADRVLQIFRRTFVGLACAMPVIFWPPAGPQYYRLFVALAVAGIGAILWASARRWRAGRGQAAFVILAFTPYLLGLAVWMLHAHDRLVRDDEQRLMTLIGNALSLIFLSFAAAYRHRLALQENARLQSAYTHSLEQEVQERTRTLQELSDRLTLSLAERNRVMAIIGHDLRGPGASLQGLARLLADDATLFSPERLAKLAGEISHACDLQLELLNNLLVWGGTQGTGPANATGEPVEARRAVDEVWRLLHGLACSKKIAFHNDLPPSLFVRTDLQLLQTILRNLLVNAIKFTRPGGWVRARARALNGGVVEIAIVDNGVGICPQRLASLFSGRVESTPGTGFEKGTGIGLNLARDLARTAGGDIRIESELDRGTTVFAILP